MRFKVVTDKHLPEIRAGRSDRVFGYRKDSDEVADRLEERKAEAGNGGEIRRFAYKSELAPVCAIQALLEFCVSETEDDELNDVFAACFQSFSFEQFLLSTSEYMSVTRTLDEA